MKVNGKKNTNEPTVREQVLRAALITVVQFLKAVIVTDEKTGKVTMSLPEDTTNKPFHYETLNAMVNANATAMKAWEKDPKAKTERKYTLYSYINENANSADAPVWVNHGRGVFSFTPLGPVSADDIETATPAVRTKGGEKQAKRLTLEDMLSNL